MMLRGEGRTVECAERDALSSIRHLQDLLYNKHCLFEKLTWELVTWSGRINTNGTIFAQDLAMEIQGLDTLYQSTFGRVEKFCNWLA